MRRTGFLSTAAAAALPAPAFQTRSTGGVTTGTSMTITLPSGVTAGDFILVIAGGSRTGALSSSLTGYTKMCEASNASGGGAGFLTIWGKIAGGSETNPSLGVGTGNTNMSYIAERWSGVVGFSTALSGVNDATLGTGTLTSNTVVTTVANSVVVTAIGGRTITSGDVSPSWGGGATSAYGTASARIGYCNNATETKASAASVTHTCGIVNAQGSPSNNIGSVILAPA